MGNAGPVMCQSPQRVSVPVFDETIPPARCNLACLQRMPLAADACDFVVSRDCLEDAVRMRPVPEEELPLAVAAHQEPAIWREAELNRKARFQALAKSCRV
jgi:hypothetical protein